MSKCHFCLRDPATEMKVPIRKGPGGPIAAFFEGPICEKDAALLENGRGA